jgi:hypothetical protein
MKRRQRDLNVFTISAIDLFACATGAFILLSLILFQYYLKKDDKPPEPVPVPADMTAEEAKETIQKLTAALDEAKKETQDLRLETERNRQLAFLGIITKAKSFVVLIDLSKSMSDYQHLMLRTVGELIGQMDESNTCQILTFQGHVSDWQRPPRLMSWAPKGDLRSMDEANKQSAMDFVESLEGKFDGGTPTYMVLNEALRYDAEAIFLLTDGEPTDIEYWQEIVKRITQENGGRKAIFSVALGYYRKLPELVDFLDALSKENDGKFLGVSD